MSAAERAAAARQGAGLFRLEDRGILEVAGGDRVRWLDGMVSNDVAGLVPGSEHSGCYALLLTRQGRIVADLHVLLRGESFWLETAAAALPHVIETLERYIIADDVTLEDRSAEFERLALEGAAAPALLDAALGAPLALGPDACCAVALAGAEVVVAAWGWSGAPARQLFTAAGGAARLAATLRAADTARDLVEGDAETLEVLRVEAGVPRLGAELDEEVLPAEARLESAVSFTKGCYTGQEVVARMESRGRAAHRLVGLRFAAAPAPRPGAAIEVEGRRSGELTSSCVSAAAGCIALGFVRSAHAEVGTEVEAEGRPAQVVALPFVSGTPA